uniref:Uncharacterized protein n=1 Tax=Amphimedon queenslandica TaxID=400682 RepID=A0A1X7TSI6_AMPQE
MIRWLAYFVKRLGSDARVQDLSNFFEPSHEGDAQLKPPQPPLGYASFIVPVAIRLGHDKVAQIRDSASRLIGSLLHKFSQSSPTTCSLILTQLRTSFATSERWLLRL